MTGRATKCEVIQVDGAIQRLYHKEIDHIHSYSVDEILLNPQCSVCLSAKKLIEEGVLVAGRDF